MTLAIPSPATPPTGRLGGAGSLADAGRSERLVNLRQAVHSQGEQEGRFDSAVWWGRYPMAAGEAELFRLTETFSGLGFFERGDLSWRLGLLHIGHSRWPPTLPSASPGRPPRPPRPPRRSRPRRSPPRRSRPWPRNRCSCRALARSPRAPPTPSKTRSGRGTTTIPRVPRSRTSACAARWPRASTVSGSRGRSGARPTS